MRRLIVILAIGIVALGFLITWFSGNFFYDLFWAFLEQHHIRQVDVIAYTLGHATPFILATVVVMILFFGIRYELLRQYAQQYPADDIRAVRAQHAVASALREHTTELQRQREAANNPMSSPMVRRIFERHDKRERIAMGLEPDPNKPALSVKVHEGAAFDGDAPSRDCWIFLAELRGGDKSLSNCQLILETGHGHTHVISKRFDLRSGEPKMMPLIRYRKTDNSQECRAFIPMSRDNGEWTGGNLVLGPDRYTIKVLSQEAKPMAFDVQLSKHPKSVGDWILEEVPHDRET